MQILKNLTFVRDEYEEMKQGKAEGISELWLLVPFFNERMQNSSLCEHVLQVQIPKAAADCSSVRPAQRCVSLGHRKR